MSDLLKSVLTRDKGVISRDIDRLGAIVADAKSKLTGSLTVANVAGKGGAGVSARIIASIKLLTDILKHQESLSKELHNQVNTMDKSLGRLKSAVLSEGIKLNYEGIVENYARYKDYVAAVEQEEQEIVIALKKIRDEYAGKNNLTAEEIAILRAQMEQVRAKMLVIDNHEKLVKSSDVTKVLEVMVTYGGLQGFDMNLMFENMAKARADFLKEIERFQSEIAKKEQNIPQNTQELEKAIASLSTDVAQKKVLLRQNLDTGALSKNLTLRKVNKKEMDVVLQECTTMWALIANLVQQQNEIEFRLVQMNSFDQELKSQISNAKRESINLITETLTHGQQRMS